MNSPNYHFAAQLIIVLSGLNGRCTGTYAIPPGTGYHAPTTAGYDYAWQLYEDVFNGTYPYNKYMGPWVLMSDFIDVYMQADILGIDTIYGSEQELQYTHWMMLHWYDQHLVWDPANYNGQNYMTVLQSNIFLPDITALERKSAIPLVAESNRECFIRNDGWVYIIIQETVIVHCDLDVAAFPYDTQTCSQTYQSVFFDEFMGFHFYAEAGKFRTNRLNPIVEFDLISYTSENTSTANIVTGYPQGQVIVTMVLQRKSSYFTIMFVVPSILITSLALLGMFTPANSHQDRAQKVDMGLTSLLTMSIVLLMLTDYIPKENTANFPFLGWWCIGQIILSAVGTIVAVVIMYLNSRAAYDDPVPMWLLRFVRLTHNNIVMDEENEALEHKGQAAIDALVDDSEKIYEWDGPQTVKPSDPMSVGDTAGDVAASTYQLLLHMRTHIKFMRDTMEKDDQEEDLFDLWERVCWRLDIICLVIFQSFNFIFLIVWFMGSVLY